MKVLFEQRKKIIFLGGILTGIALAISIPFILWKRDPLYWRLFCIAKIDRILEICINVTKKMDSVFDGVLSAAADGVLSATAGEPDDIPKSNTTVWILGKSYNSIQGLLEFIY